MCGFAGFISYSGSGDLGLLKSMSDTIIHRGPDDSGHELLHFNGSSIGLAFRRLSIIDLSAAGHQPMYSKDRSVCVMLNGEIYNYREIREELKSSGYSFVSGSDTEVVIASYLKNGFKAFDSFIGMFAIVLADMKNGKVVLLRDRAGIKPLFYSVHPDGIIFGSELKSFHKHPSFSAKIDEKALHTFFYYGNIPAPHSIFESTYKVEPGSFVQVDLMKRSCLTEKYWDVFQVYNKATINISYEEALKETERLMASAFNYRMVADVPVGVFLSGGYDSTAVAALLNNSVSRLNTFTIGFREPEYDESAFAKKVASHLGTHHQTLECTINDALDIIPDLPSIYDEPFGDSSAIPTILVSRLARKHVTVALSADAGDELFAGYPRHAKSVNYLSKVDKVPGPMKAVTTGVSSWLTGLNSISSSDRFAKLARFLSSGDRVAAFDVINQTFTRDEINRLMQRKVSPLDSPFYHGSELKGSLSILNTVLALEYKTYLVDDILQKVDRATMSVSLEGREPFLDHRLVEWAAGLPDEFKVYQGVQKRILKDIVHQYVPRDLMERPKMGFGVPVKSWLKNELLELFEEVMSESVLKDQPYLNSKVVLSLKRDYLNGRVYDFERLWFVFVFLQWYRKWIR
ncbi:MAG: asparagine synthase (glutamine-hydrolyzing) [Bacteroidia bacterium]